ncbi:MAG TPA: dual specificity protein phosphatase family protein [Candidatus Solibacter sp.]|nr:dual specificity protein phosphatase family protein [Candidatus Solibacter sp.]
MDCAFVTTNLSVGPCPDDVADFEELKLRGISAILSLQSAEDVENDAGWEPATAQAAGLAFRNVPVMDFDSLDLKLRLPRCVQVLDEMVRAGQRIYLHCTAGVSRSPTVAAAYLHWCMNWPLDEALDHLKKMRNCCPLADVIRSAHWPAQ